MIDFNNLDPSMIDAMVYTFGLSFIITFASGLFLTRLLDHLKVPRVISNPLTAVTTAIIFFLLVFEVWRREIFI